MPDDDKNQTSGQTGDYTYYETAGANTQSNRTLPPVPGQSDPRRVAELDSVADGIRALQLNESRNSQIESFFLRQLGTFKGEYNGEAITEWVEKVDLLKDLLRASDSEIIRILPLRLSSRAVEFLRSFLATRERAEHSWADLKRAFLTQFGGQVDPTQRVNQLQQAKMGRSTPVREFGLQVGRLARLAYPELSSDIGTADQKKVQRELFNRIALEQFTAGLPPLLSRPILEHRVTDFQAAVDLAAHHEEINRRFMSRATVHAMYDGDHPPALPHGAFPEPALARGAFPEPALTHGAFPEHYMAPINQYEAPGHVTTGQNRGGQPGGRRGRGPYLRSNRSVLCHACKKPGHYKRECVRCQICGEWGHVMAKCLNIVCAACKGTGHPANFCSKNFQSRDQTRPPNTHNHNSNNNSSTSC